VDAAAIHATATSRLPQSGDKSPQSKALRSFPEGPIPFPPFSGRTAFGSGSGIK